MHHHLRSHLFGVVDLVSLLCAVAAQTYESVDYYPRIGLCGNHGAVYDLLPNLEYRIQDNLRSNCYTSYEYRCHWRFQIKGLL
jgi:hypothetical protein